MAVWSGGARLLAARLVDTSNILDLDLRDNVPATWTQWGGQLSFTNPGVDVAVCAWLGGRAYTNGSGKYTLMCRIEISHDNGANWSTGPENWLTVEPSGVSGTDQKQIFVMHRAQALPSGTVRVRAMVQSAGSTNIQLRTGHLMAQMTAV